MVGITFFGTQMLPGPVKVLTAIAVQAQSGDLFFQLGVTLARVFAAFTIAMMLWSVETLRCSTLNPQSLSPDRERL